MGRVYEKTYVTRLQPLRALSLVWGECTAALYIISGAKRSPRRRPRRRKGGRKEGAAYSNKKQNLTQGVRKNVNDQVSAAPGS